jgi:hypothetical protein
MLHIFRRRKETVRHQHGGALLLGIQVDFDSLDPALFQDADAKVDRIGDFPFSLEVETNVNFLWALLRLDTYAGNLPQAQQVSARRDQVRSIIPCENRTISAHFPQSA